MTTRNSPCPCGSGKRNKHCCGKIDSLSSHLEISDQDLLAALKRADDHHLAEGLEPSARHLMNIGKALQEFGIHAILMGRGTPPIVDRTRQLCDLLFIPKELQSGGMHLGAYLFRDMFCRLYAPIAFGTAHIEFWKLIDLNDVQRQWLASIPEELDRFTDQAADILDFGYGWQEFGHGRTLDARGQDLIWRSHAQLEAAAATATSAYDFRGTVQSALLGAELALKAGLAALGISDAELRSRAIGHDLKAAANRLAGLVPGLDLDRIQRVVALFPPYVASRYDTPPPGRVETGHILMGAQFIASEVTRQFSDRNCRSDNPSAPSRKYPV
ncbi:SEC-C metal-binding domain-containing protein [Sphingobium sp. H39-3-25]|uniref:YecA family protein n=1 Tax=Sphingobium arseniciresistens TaxID=3030834 RepID=UPI0023B8D754|nr:SEC-C metal-binding domain-containing protein [Sphingobium arseniciresistens]